MNSTTKEWETTDPTDILLKARESQIKQLYKQSWIGLIGVLVVAISICVALWQVLPSWKLSLWVGILTLVTFVRGYIIVAFRRKAPVGANINIWAKWHVIGTSVSGLTWALPSFFLWPENSSEYSMIWALCILPLSASAVSTYYTWKPSYISFILLSVIPVSLRFFYEGGLSYIVLGFLSLFFIAVLLQAGSLIHTSSLRTLIVGFRNEALSLFLSEEKAKQEKLSHQLQKAHDQLQEVSLTDELTGLWNRRYLKVTIQKYVAQVIRNYNNFQQGSEKTHSGNTDIVFIMVDLDHFKIINDTYGHSAGDQVLKQMSHLLKKSCRETDIAIRWGGEEFLVVSLNVQRENDTILIERIRKAVESNKFDIGKESPIHLTCSIGAALFPFLTNHPEGLGWERAVDLADTCLYAAKRSGRNAWVTIISTDLTNRDDLTPDLAKHLPGLIKEGKLRIRSNLKKDITDCWPD